MDDESGGIPEPEVVDHEMSMNPHSTPSKKDQDNPVESDDQMAEQQGHRLLHKLIRKLKSRLMRLGMGLPVLTTTVRSTLKET